MSNSLKGHDKFMETSVKKMLCDLRMKINNVIIVS